MFFSVFLRLYCCICANSLSRTELKASTAVTVTSYFTHFYPPPDFTSLFFYNKHFDHFSVDLCWQSVFIVVSGVDNLVVSQQERCEDSEYDLRSFCMEFSRYTTDWCFNSFCERTCVFSFARHCRRQVNCSGVPCLLPDDSWDNSSC